MSRKSDYSNKILKVLGKKRIVSFPELHELGIELPNAKYAITRSLKGLKDAGLIEQISSPQNKYARLTKAGKTKLNSILLLGDDALVPQTWDGFWRIIILDISEERKNEREALRYLLKKANFVCIKNTVWISPHPYEHLFMNIKKDLGFSTELMIIVTDKLDEETSIAFLRAVKNN